MERIRPEDIAGCVPIGPMLSEIIPGDTASVVLSDATCFPCRNPWSVLMDCSPIVADSLIRIVDIANFLIRGVDISENYQTRDIVTNTLDGNRLDTETLVDGAIVEEDLAQIITTPMISCRSMYIGVLEDQGIVEAQIEDAVIRPIIIDLTTGAVVQQEVVEEVLTPQVQAEPGIR